MKYRHDYEQETERNEFRMYSFKKALTTKKSKLKGSSNYLYGFNGKERDTNLGGGTHYDYGFRIYKPKYARFLSVDPLTKSYPMLTPYQFASNTPIQAIDLDGLEAFSANAELRLMVSGEAISVTTNQTIGIIVGRSAKLGTIGISTFYTPTLGIGAGAGGVLGVTFTGYPTATMEDLEGFGGAAGVFKGFVPNGFGPIVTGEINFTQNREFGLTLSPKLLTVGTGTGGYIEGGYTIMSEPIPLSEALNAPGIEKTLDLLNISKDEFNKVIDNMFNEVLEKRKEYYNKLTDNYDPEKLRLVPGDNLNIESPKAISLSVEKK